MGQKSFLPFETGQLAESKCFRVGFRGAWFRCKIKEICFRQGQIVYALEFFDFPDEKINWTRIYQVDPTYRKSKEEKRQLMVRPQYPPVYHEHQMPPANIASEVIVVIGGVWKVGDLVDWWKDGCYWSGRLIQILGNDKVKIELFPCPIGEGSSYEACCKDLRPSLDWSPEDGWSVPTSKEGGNSRCCARLIKPVDQDLNLKNHTVDEGIKDVQATAGSPIGASISSQISANSQCYMDNKSKHSMTGDSLRQTSSTAIPEAATEKTEVVKDLEVGHSAIGKTSFSDSASSSHIRDDSTENSGHPAGEDQYFCSGPSKKMRTGGKISLNSMCSQTLEAAILDLEELTNRVKWLKRILEIEVPLSGAGRPPWKFMEHCTSYAPK